MSGRRLAKAGSSFTYSTSCTCAINATRVGEHLLGVSCYTYPSPGASVAVTNVSCSRGTFHCCAFVMSFTTHSFTICTGLVSVGILTSNEPLPTLTYITNPTNKLGSLISHAEQNHQSWVIRLPPESNPDKKGTSEKVRSNTPNYQLSTRRTVPNR